MPSVYLSPSTQEFNTTLSGRSEEYYANLIADAMIPYLNASGINYGRNSRRMTALSSAQQANEGNYDFYLAIHSNASGENTPGQSAGAEIYYYPGSTEGRRAANIFADNYKEIYPLPDMVRIIPLATLIELNKTRMPAILFEVAYHDNYRDFNWMSNNINNIARNLAMSVAEYFDIPFITPGMFASGTVSTRSGNLNVRSGPSINSDIIGTLKNGDKVRITEYENGWLKIRYGNSSGYVNSRFIKA